MAVFVVFVYVGSAVALLLTALAARNRNVPPSLRAAEDAEQMRALRPTTTPAAPAINPFSTIS